MTQDRTARERSGGAPITSAPLHHTRIECCQEPVQFSAENDRREPSAARMMQPDGLIIGTDTSAPPREDAFDIDDLLPRKLPSVPGHAQLRAIGGELGGKLDSLFTQQEQALASLALCCESVV